MAAGEEKGDVLQVVSQQGQVQLHVYLRNTLYPLQVHSAPGERCYEGSLGREVADSGD